MITSGSRELAEVNVTLSLVVDKSPVSVNVLPSNVKLASPFNASPLLNVAILLSAPLATAETAPLPLAASHTAFEPSHFKNWPDEGESCPIFVTFPEPSNVNAAVPPASLSEPPSSKIISVVTFKSPAIVVVDAAPAPIVTSTCPSVACSPSNTKPAVNAVSVPSLSATKRDNLPASSVLSDSDISATIFANIVLVFPSSSP